MSQMQHQSTLARPRSSCPISGGDTTDLRPDQAKAYQVSTDQAEIDQMNELLKQTTDWEVELAVSPHDQHRFLRVYQVQPGCGAHRKRAFLGAIQWGIDPEHLVAAAAISGAYYRLGLVDGRQTNRRPKRNSGCQS